MSGTNSSTRGYTTGRASVDRVGDGSDGAFASAEAVAAETTAGAESGGFSLGGERLEAGIGAVAGASVGGDDAVKAGASAGVKLETAPEAGESASTGAPGDRGSGTASDVGPG